MPREADPNKRYPSLAIPTQIRLPVLVESLMENRIQSFSRDKDVYNSLLFPRYCSLVIPVDNRIVEFYLYLKKNIYFQILSVKFADRKCVHFFSLSLLSANWAYRCARHPVRAKADLSPTIPPMGRSFRTEDIYDLPECTGLMWFLYSFLFP